MHFLSWVLPVITSLVLNKKHTVIPSCFLVPQDPNEDEETRQYRLKIEEQKRLREEILKTKEMRRQMQAGVRKKELLERISSQTPTPQIQPAQQNQQMPQPVQPQQQQQQQRQQQPPPQQQPQRQLPQRAPQPLNQTFKNPIQVIPPNGNPQILTPRPNVKARLQMVKGNIQQQQQQQQQTPQVHVPDQQWTQPNPQQRRNCVQIRPGAQIQTLPQKNIPVAPQIQTPGPPQAGAKRTVMQRTKSVDDQQVPQKVRVVKLSGAVSISFCIRRLQISPREGKRLIAAALSVW